MPECEACRLHFDPKIQRARYFLGQHTFCQECQKRFQYLEDCIRDASNACIHFYAIEIEIGKTVNTALRSLLGRRNLPSQDAIIAMHGNKLDSMEHWQTYAQDYFRYFGNNLVANLRRKLLRRLRQNNYELSNMLKAAIKRILDFEKSLAFYRIRDRRRLFRHRVRRL